MLARLSLGLAALAASATAIDTISAKGSKFFTSSGQQWFIKGVAYQLSPDDPLVDGSQCQTDASLMQTLGANAIRVYHVDPTQNHDACMSAFANAGIYVFLDLDTFATYINVSPTQAEWTQRQYSAFSAVMDAFHNYDNIAGFFVGNEVLNQLSQASFAPYVKAAARDMKAYRDQKNYRDIPIGYSAADIAELRPMLQNYLACGNNTDDIVDFFGLNAYEWCGDADYQTSGYATLQQLAEGYNVPIFFSETGCNKPEPRSFADQAAILGPDMDGTWSGAIIYEWIQEENQYGLINYDPASPTVVRSGTPTPLQPDFSNLQNQWKTLNPTGISAAAYSPTVSTLACPASTAGAWSVDPAAPLPTIGQAFSGGAEANAPSASSTGSTGSTGSTASPTGAAKSSSSSTGTATAKSTSSHTSSSSAGSATGAQTSTGAAARGIDANSVLSSSVVYYGGSLLMSLAVFCGFV